jgi:prephenate dehydratase
MTIGCFGPKGTFTDYAYQQAAPLRDCSHLPVHLFHTFPTLFEALASDTVSGIFSPIENVIEGPVNPVLDALVDYEDLAITASYTMPIHQSLISCNPTLQITDITDIISMPHAIAQCHGFIHRHFPHATVHHSSSTAAALTRLTDLQLPIATTALIGHKGLCDYHDCVVIHDAIHDHNHNATEFGFIEKITAPPSSPIDMDVRAMVAFSTPHDQPGSLVGALTLFHNYNMNMTKILSRPNKNRPGAYIFYVEFSMAGHTIADRDGLCRELKAASLFFRFLGHYGRYHLHD